MKNRPRPNNTVFHDYKFRASRKNIPFELTRDDVAKIIIQNCFYCGSPPSNSRKPNRRKESFKYNGIDRIEGRKGYVLENVVPCCHRCNFSKWSFSTEDFLNHINRISRFQRKKRRKKVD